MPSFLYQIKSFFSFNSSAQHRLCDFCHEKVAKESLQSNYTILDDSDNDNETKDNPNLKFEVRSECLTPTTITTTDNQSSSSSSQEQ